MFGGSPNAQTARQQSWRLRMRSGRYQFDVHQATVNSWSDLRPALVDLLYNHSSPGLSRFFEELKRRTGINRVHFAYMVLIAIVFLLLCGREAGLLCNAICIAYPCYACMLQVFRGYGDEALPWLVYWTIFSTFSLTDIYGEQIMRLVPFYWLFKVSLFVVTTIYGAGFMVYLFMPQTRGVQKVYVYYIEPWLIQRLIDSAGGGM